MPIFLPSHIVEEAISSAHEAKHIMEFRERLRALDSRFGLFLQDTDHPDLRKGFYYIFRRSDDGRPPALWEVSGANGEFTEPGEAHLEALRYVDSSRTDQRVLREQNRRRQERERESLKQSKANDRQEHLKDLLSFRRLQMFVRGK